MNVETETDAIPTVDTETDAIPTVDTSNYQASQIKIKKEVVKIPKYTIPTLNIEGDTISPSYKANQSKKNVNLAHVETERDTIPTSGASNYQANQIKKEVNVVHVGTVNHGTISIGNKIVTNYGTKDYSDYGPRSLAARKRILPTISEELKSSTLPLSVDNKYHIADNIGSNWKRMARMLPDADFSDGQLENLQRSSENQTELVVNVLNRWHQVAPNTATIGNLAKTLEKIKLNDLAVGLENK